MNASESDVPARRTSARAGLCPACAHVKLVRSPRGSVFLLCRLSAMDPSFAKYPPQPVLVCSGHAGTAPSTDSR